MLAQTRSRLLAAARQAFGSATFAATSMDERMASEGLIRGGLYRRFAAKEGRLEAVIRQIDEEVALRCRRKLDAAANVWDGFVACGRTDLRLAVEPGPPRAT